MSKTIDAFTKAKEELITEFFAALKTLADLKDTLKKHGVKIPKKSPSGVKVKTAKAKGPRGKWDEEKAIAFLGNKEHPLVDVAKHVGVGKQTVTNKIKDSKKFEWRNENEKNPKSPLLVKVK